MSVFKVGMTVEWRSSANGSTKHKVGEIVAVVPAKQRPAPKFRLDSSGLPRDHESYVIAVKCGKTDKAKPKLYWPRVAALQLSN